MPLNKKTQEYFDNLQKEVKKVYDVAEQAKSKGLDPVEKVEIPLATNMAEKVEGLISTIYPQLKNSGVVKRILELENQYGKLDPTVVFKISEDVAKQKFCQFSSLIEAIDAGIRVAFAYQTIAVVASPLEGYTGLKLGKTKEGKEYFKAYFSGPIRSAGTTASCIVLMVIDYLRELFGYAKYDPDENEIKRYITENYDYHERVTNLQYLPLKEEIEFLAKNLPIQIAGEPTEKREVSNYKNLERVDTNNIRGGMCLIFSEGLAQKAAKGFRLLKKAKSNGIESSGWDFLEEYLELHEKLTKAESKEEGGKKEVPTYIKDLVAGRPVYGHPSRSGSFRFRYGRARNSGFSASSVHPATMAVTNNFLATGTQLKIEKPTKGTAVTPCDSIDGPIVKLVDGSVKKLKDFTEAKRISENIKEIIYIGDFLMPFSDVVNRNADLLKPGYVEEWWSLELSKKNSELNKDPYEIDLDDAIKLSEKYQIPLHPEYIFYWNQLSNEQFSNLIDWLLQGKYEDKIILPFTKDYRDKFEKGKRALEILGIEHKVSIENVVLPEIISKAFFINLGVTIENIKDKQGFLISDVLDKSKFELKKENVLDIINENSKFVIKDKAGDFIGARMGRPEKAKLRKLQGSPNILFPVGNEGGRLRSVLDAVNVGYVKSSWPIFYCEKCGKESIFPRCGKCHEKCKSQYYFYESKKKSFSENVEGKKGRSYAFDSFDISSEFQNALKNLNMKNGEIPELIKGVRGMSSGSKIPEKLEKGILRAKYNLQVNKDGTIRFDGTELPITHFKPREIFTDIETLKKLGYSKDIYGKPLENEDQILELMPHDVLLPCPSDTPDEKADDVFFNISKFVDEELEKFYKLKKFHNLKDKKGLAGQLGVFMAPHNCAGVICRFIGISKNQAVNASPYMHAAVRRDCFGYDTYIPLKKDGKWSIKKIGDVVEELNPSNVVDNFETKEVKVNNFKSIGFDNKISTTRINNFTKHKKNQMYEIKTSLGKKITITENHKFLINGKKRRASNLKIGDEIPLPYKIDIPAKDNKTVNLLEVLDNKNIMIRNVRKIIQKIDTFTLFKILRKLNISKKQFMNFKSRDSFPADFILSLSKKIQKEISSKGKISYKRDRISLPIIIPLKKDLLEVIGLYLAEGYSRRIVSQKGLNQVYIAAEKKEIRKLITKVFKKYFELKPTENKKDRVTFSSRVLYEFFIHFLKIGSRAREKRIPSLFLDLPKEKLSALLRGYFEGDGSVSLTDKRVCCDSVSEGLLHDLEFCLGRFGIFVKRYEYVKKPGPKLKDFYLRKKRDIPKFKITKLIIGSNFILNFNQIGFLSLEKKKKLSFHNSTKHLGMRIKKDNNFVYDPIVEIKDMGKKESYCLNVENKNHLVVANSILSFQCDGDEAAIMLLSDVLLNFSKEFLPSHRGGTQDAPLVLNSKIDAGEVDDQILDLEVTPEGKYPLELYELAEQRKHSSEIKGITDISSLLKQNKDPFINLGFTHCSSDINKGVNCSSYKTLATMAEKVEKQMGLVEKLRGADVSDTARLVIERHFIRDMKGNLRSFSQQNFRCVKCNEIFRRPPLKGVCSKCKGKIIFTIHEGGIKKYLEPALVLAEKYHLSPYLVQSLELVKGFIEGIFGKEPEQQEALEKWFN
ncbi:MAG: DNA polymerase II large subunit [Nanoarchaeota archaeon]